MCETPTVTTPARATETAVGLAHGRARKELVAATVGGFVESFDWMVYAAMVPFFAVHIFPGDDPVTALLGAYVGFAVGFVARPLGSVLIGRLADRHGRRLALVVSVLGSAAANLLIAVTPTAATIGAWAAGLVVMARVIMGICMGGETASAAAYVTETAPAGRRYTYSAISYAGVIAGPMLAFATVGVLLAILGQEQVRAGGWRIAFVIAAVAGLAALWIRSAVAETHTFTEQQAADRRAQHERMRLWPVLRRNMRLMVAIFLAVIGGTIAGYFGTVYLPVYAALNGVTTQADASQLMTPALVVLLLLMVVAGRLGDRFGGFVVFRAGYLLLAVLSVPLLTLLAAGVVPFFVAAVVYLACLAPVLAPVNVIGAQLFPTRIRVLGYGITYTFAVAVFGGTTPLLAQALATAGRLSWLPWYVAGSAALSLAATLLIRASDVKLPYPVR
jgi:MFS transporter, MHS family, alpha-ketoglutarate permease